MLKGTVSRAYKGNESLNKGPVGSDKCVNWRVPTAIQITFEKPLFKSLASAKILNFLYQKFVITGFLTHHIQFNECIL
jgi:hypothetical protein